MSTAPWARLAEPFPAAALAWHVTGRGPDGTRLRLAPHLPADALRARLDEAAGPEGWSLRLRSWGEAGLLAELTVLGATRAGAARVAEAPGEAAGAAAASAAAFSAAAAGFGMHPPVVVVDDGWVDADPDSGEHLHLPDTLARGEATGEEAVAGEDRSGAAVGTGAAAEGGGAEGEIPATPDPQAPEPKPEAQRMIDRLMERLREEGLGAEAAKLVMSYGGYGRDPQASRELYARLRSLLIERGTR